MPVIRPSGRWEAQVSREVLVDQLAQELLGRSQDQGPYIFELPITNTDTVHVIVVWDGWTGVPPEERSSIILEAYARRDESLGDEDPLSPQVTMVIGVAVGEAFRLNLLPYRVETTVPGEANPEDVGRAMRAEGAIEFANRLLLAFPSRQMAEEAYRRLIKRLPKAGWYLHEERA